jgi:hypothetical protein
VPSGGFALLYLWIAPFAFAVFSLRQAAAIALVVAVGFTIAAGVAPGFLVDFAHDFGIDSSFSKVPHSTRTGHCVSSDASRKPVSLYQVNRTTSGVGSVATTQ